MITPSFGLTATERVLPRLALDFTTASLDSRITFTRALNTATRTNASGFVEVVNADLPRFDYDPITLACKGLLIEEARTNSLLYSNAFNDAYWGKTRTSITENAIISPDGTLNASKLVEDTQTGSHHIARSSVSFTNGTSYTLSGYYKAGERTQVSLILGNNGTPFPSTANHLATFNLLTGALVSAGSSLTATSITNVGNGWYRCSITAVAQATANDQIYFASIGSYTGDGTSGLYIYGAQLEAGAFPTSYIPTTTTSLTRNADVATMTGTNFSDWYSDVAGTFMCQAIPYVQSYTVTRQMMTVGGNSPLYVNQNSTVVRTFDGTTVISATGQIQANTAFKCAVSYDTNGRSVSKDASTPVTGTYDGSFGTTAFNIGSNGSAFFWNGHIQKINWYKQKLLNAEVQVITK